MGIYLLGIDAGTSSMKAILLNTRGETVSTAHCPYTMAIPQPGWAEMSAEALWNAAVTCVAQLGQEADLGRVAGIGISCMCPGLTALDEHNQPLIDPILYADRRSIAEGEWIRQQVGADKLFSITANGSMAGAISGTSMVWVKRNRPEVYEKTRYFGHINSFLCARMTGNVAIDPSNASYTAMYETAANGGWSEDLCGAIGIDREKLPPILESCQVCGTLIDRTLIEAGLPAGIPVVIGGADTACAAVACGAVRPGDLFESAGTTNVLTLCVDQPLFCREFINRRHAVPGKWIYQGAMSNVGLSQKWCREELCRDLIAQADAQNISIYALLDQEALASTPGANGALLLPYLTGERCPVWDPNAKGVLFGITPCVHRCDLVRATMESCCYGTRQMLEIAEGLTGQHFHSIDLVGGGAASSVWAQIKADITGKEIRILAQKNSAAIGAAVLAGVGAGVFPSVEAGSDLLDRSAEQTLQPTQDTAAREAYAQQYQRYAALYQHLKPLF